MINIRQNTPKVSILIPVYNREEYIGDCIESALNQTVHDIDIVVVDNASSDNTLEICNSLASRDGRLRVFRNQTNLGPVRNWIRCVDEAKGEFCKILFSDDLLEPDCVEQMLDAMESEKVGFVFCATRIGQSPKNSSVSYLLDEGPRLDRSKYLELFVDGVLPVSPGAMLFRSSDLSKNLLTNIPTAASRAFCQHGAGPDVMISLLTAMDYSTVAYLKKPLVFFRVHSGSFTVHNEDGKITEAYTSAISYFLKTSGLERLWARYLAKRWIGKMQAQGRWVNLRKFSIAHEGSGKLLELVQIIVSGAKLGIRKLFKKTEMRK